MVEKILEGFMLKVNFRKNHDRLRDQKQTEMRDVCIGIAPHGVKESVLGSSMSLKFHFSTPVPLDITWQQTQWGALDLGPLQTS